MVSRLVAASVACFVLSFPTLARAATTAWSTGTSAAVDVAAGRPLVVHVVVALCDNAQIQCGSKAAGRPADRAKNVYWGAVFGHARMFDGAKSGFTRVASSTSVKGVLERVTYSKTFAGAPWGVAGDVTELVVFDAVDGARIDDAMRRVEASAALGEALELELAPGGPVAKRRVHVAGYAGHNRMLDGLAMPARAKPSSAAIPSFALACHSDSTFGAHLRAAGSRTLVTTKALMAPEGYLTLAIAKALGANEPASGVRAAAVAAYAKWQKLRAGQASSTFAK